MSAGAAASQFWIDRRTVAAVLDRAGVSRRHELTTERLEEAARLYEAGWSGARLGERFDVTPDTMLKRLRSVGVAIRSRPGWPPSGSRSR